MTDLDSTPTRDLMTDALDLLEPHALTDRRLDELARAYCEEPYRNVSIEQIVDAFLATASRHAKQ